MVKKSMIFIFIVFSLIYSQDSLNCREVGYYDTPGNAHGVAVANNYAYVADGGAGLRIIDVSNPSNPFEVGYYDTPSAAGGVAVANSYAYVADYLAGLRIIDVSNPRNPFEVGYYDTPGYAYGVALANNYAYVADEGAGLRIIDVSNPRNPYEVGYYNTPSFAWDVAVANNYAYVADGDAGLRIIEFYGIGIKENNFSKEKILTSHILNIDKETNLLDITGRKITKSKNLKKGIYFIKEKSITKKIIVK